MKKAIVFFLLLTLIACGGGGGGTAGSTTDTTPPGPALPNAPSNIAAVAGNAQATVSWSSVTGAASYNIYWSATTGVNKSTGTKISNVTSPYTHTGLTNGSVYYYVVTSINSAGESAESVQVSATLTLVVGSSRSAPYARTQVAVAPNRDVQVMDMVRGTSAWNTILAANQFNDPAPAGTEYLLVKLHVKSTYADSNVHTVRPADFSVTGNKLIDYSYAGVVLPTPALSAQLYTGGETEGWAAFLVGVGETKLILIVDEWLNSDESKKRFIALEDGASLSVDPALGNIAPTTIGTSRTNPAPLLQKVITNDWEITVIQSVRGDAAWQQIIAANQFNDPPAAGREYILATVRVRYIGTDDKPVIIDNYDFKTTGSANVIYSLPSVVVPDPELNVSLYPGGVYEGLVATQAAQGESGVMLMYKPLFDSGDTNTRFLLLQ